jgi:hypothetical protein
VVADVAASGGVRRESARRDSVQGWQLACLQVGMQQPTAHVTKVRGLGVYGVQTFTPHTGSWPVPPLSYHHKTLRAMCQ